VIAPANQHIATPDGVVHRAVYYDAIYWRPACDALPYPRPRGYKKKLGQPLTCFVCLAGPTAEEILLGLVGPDEERNRRVKAPWRNTLTKNKRISRHRFDEHLKKKKKRKTS